MPHNGAGFGHPQVESHRCGSDTVIAAQSRDVKRMDQSASGAYPSARKAERACRIISSRCRSPDWSALQESVSLPLPTNSAPAPGPILGLSHPGESSQHALQLRPHQNGSRFPDANSHPCNRPLQRKFRDQSRRDSIPPATRPPSTNRSPDSDRRFVPAALLRPQSFERTLRNQVQRQLVEQAIKTVRRKRRGISLPRRFLPSGRHPLQPRRIF